MKRKRILILTHVIWPFESPRSFRGTELAIEFAEQGHEVVLFCHTGNYNYLEFEKKKGLSVRCYGKFKLVKKSCDFNGNYTFLEKMMLKLFKRVFDYPNIEFLFKVKKALKKEKGYDLLISIASPHSIHWGTAWALRENPQLTKKWIADCGDPFMGNQFTRPPFYFKYFEKWFCKMADRITVPIPEAISGYYAEFHDKIEVIPQGFNFEDITLYEGKVKNEIPTFAYAGMVYKSKRDPTEFLKFLAQLNIDFKFIVYTGEPNMFLPFKEILGKKMDIKKYIPRNQLIYELSKMTFLVNIENTQKEQSPSKLIDYALTKRPILNVTTPTFDSTHLMEFLNGNYQSAKKIMLEKYKIKNIAEKFLTLT